jgi:hypothetical protein
MKTAQKLLWGNALRGDQRNGRRADQQAEHPDGSGDIEG